MDEGKYIGFLMKKQPICEGVIMFYPDHIVYGDLVVNGTQRFFLDEYDESYFLMEEPESAFTDHDVVGYLIEKDKLLAKYQTQNIREAKTKYSNDIKSTTDIGFYHHKNDEIIILNLDFQSLLNYFNTQELTDSSNSNLSASKLASLLFNRMQLNKSSKSDENSKENLSTKKIFMIDLESLKKLISLSDKDLKTEMNNIYNVCDKKDLDLKNKEIVEKIEKSYASLLKIDDIDKLKNLAASCEDLYLELVCSIDDNQNIDDNSKERIKDFLYKTIDTYHSITTSDDIKGIKESMKTIMNRQKEYLQSFSNEDGYIENSNATIKNNDENDKKDKRDILFNPKEMKKFLDEKIIGQEQAKKDIVSAIFMNSLSDEAISKNTCLLVGPTGSGKTLIAKSVADYLNLPIVNIDTTQLTVPGYVGASLEDFLVNLVEKANGNIKEAEKGIVILDEVDKKGSSNNSDVSGKGVLNTLLPFIQGTTYTLTYKQRKIPFDTSKLTIFMTGAFTDVAKGVSNNSGYNNTQIGFKKSDDKEKLEDISYKQLTIEDFVKYGNFPIELIGRISTITQLGGHTKESLKSILTDSNISILKLEQEKLKKLNIEIRYGEDYLDAVASKAMELKTGARSLKSTVENSIKEARWEVITNPDEYDAIILNKDTVDDNKKAILLHKDGNYNNVYELYDNVPLKNNYQMIKK